MVRNKEYPLFSICIISYNSAETILQTLDSVFNQTYKNIELIVSDDYSTDDTVTVVENWISKHKDRFYSCKIITVDKNTGVTANCNRAVKTATGTYVKDFGADDLLLPEYVEDCIHFFSENPDCGVLFTKVIEFLEDDTSKILNIPKDYDFLRLDASEQFSWIRKRGVPGLPTPSVCYRKTVLEKVDYFDEEIPMWEDGPMYFKLAEKGVKMWLVEKNDVLYRYRNDSLCHGRPLSHMKSAALFFFKYTWNYEIKDNPIKAIYHALKYFSLLHSDIWIFRFFYYLSQLHVERH